MQFCCGAKIALKCKKKQRNVDFSNILIFVEIQFALLKQSHLSQIQLRMKEFRIGMNENFLHINKLKKRKAHIVAQTSLKPLSKHFIVPKRLRVTR